MAQSNLYYRCYILPVTGMVAYLILSFPPIKSILQDWIPNPAYLILITSFLLLIILFVTCRIMDLVWTHGHCHDAICENVNGETAENEVTFNDGETGILDENLVQDRNINLEIL